MSMKGIKGIGKGIFRTNSSKRIIIFYNFNKILLKVGTTVLDRINSMYKGWESRKNQPEN